MRRPGEQHIGNPHGLIAIWCNESEAFDIASHYPWPDKLSQEIGEAVERAYPKDEDGRE
jgi:hypothetical protein